MEEFLFFLSFWEPELEYHFVNNSRYYNECDLIYSVVHIALQKYEWNQFVFLLNFE